MTTMSCCNHIIKILLFQEIKAWKDFLTTCTGSHGEKKNIQYGADISAGLQHTFPPRTCRYKHILPHPSHPPHTHTPTTLPFPSYTHKPINTTQRHTHCITSLRSGFCFTLPKVNFPGTDYPITMNLQIIINTQSYRGVYVLFWQYPHKIPCRCKPILIDIPTRVTLTVERPSYTWTHKNGKINEMFSPVRVFIFCCQCS